MKNWAGYYEYLNKIFIDLEIERNETKDPYKQWALDEKKILTNEIMTAYMAYLRQIGADSGIQFLKTLENKVEEIHGELSEGGDYDKQIVLSAKINLASIFFKEFKLFRLKP